MLQPDEALRLEPMLNPDLKLAVRVPDATMDAMRMPLRFFATAKANGAELLNYLEVTGLELHDGVVSGAVVHDQVTGASGDPRRPRGERDRTVVGEGRADGRRRRPDPAHPPA